MKTIRLSTRTLFQFCLFIACFQGSILGWSQEAPGDSIQFLENLAYGTESPLQKLDLYLPRKTVQKAPLILWIHGGAFTSGSKKSPFVTANVRQFTRQGMAVASLNYRLLPEIWPAQIVDIFSALAFLAEQADQLGIDPGRTGVIGFSAGANLGTLLGTLSDTSAYMTMDLNPLWGKVRIKAVVDLSGIFDYSTLKHDSNGKGDKIVKNIDGKISDLFGTTNRKMLEGMKKEASPITFLTPGDPAFLIIRGRREIVPAIQSEQFLRKAKMKGLNIQILEERDDKHGQALFEPFGDSILGFFASHLLDPLEVGGP